MDLAVYINEMVDNSIKSLAKKIDIAVDENQNENYISFKVIDNGKGINKEKLNDIRNPFVNNGISLSIPMLEQVCTLCKGDLSIESHDEKGTKICAVMEYNNIDRPPLGDIAQTVSNLITKNPQVNFRYIHKYNDRQYVFDMEKIKGIMNDTQMSEPSMVIWIIDTINGGIAGLK